MDVDLGQGQEAFLRRDGLPVQALEGSGSG